MNWYLSIVNTEIAPKRIIRNSRNSKSEQSSTIKDEDMAETPNNTEQSLDTSIESDVYCKYLVSNTII